MTETNAPASNQAETKDLLSCDIVMAGGVTSGIIYPGAVAKIAERYSFHCIGGTSVGAIAAAATAAAEYGRRTGRNAEAFAEIARLPEELAQRAGGHSRLFHLFTPESDAGRDTRGLFALVTPLFSCEGGWAKLAGLARFAMAEPTIRLVAAVSGAIGLLTMAWLFYLGHCLVGLIVLIPFLALVLCSAVAALAYLLAWKWLPAWRENGYGICSGKSKPSLAPDSSGLPEFDGLTPWIHRVVQTAAGRSIEDDPLTFGELWYPPNGKPPEGTDTPRAIELSMITSDISRNRAAQLPFLESPSRLYVEEEMLKRYFPTPVVAWMCKHQGDYGDNVERRAGVFRLPLPEDLPLVFAARLSLSFAVLLSAVPLLTPDYANKLPDSPIKLRDVWFSDGGLTSNFPIHFFDSPIPSRPTFCLNLVDFDAGLVAEPTPQPEQATAKDATEKKEAQTDTERDASKPIAQSRSSERRAEKRPTYDISERDPEPRDAVWKLVAMARRNEMSPAPFTSFDAGAGSGLFSFVMNLINTARFWSDNQMLMAPGTRDRVVHIGLRDDEGGLNLDMPANTIAELNRRGRAAGMLIAARFDLKGTRDPETGMDISPAFPNHRWVRYRNFMAGFERTAAQFRQARRKADMEAQGRGEPQIDDMLAGRANKLIGYRPPASAQRYYRGATNALMRFADGLDAARKANKSATFDPSGKSPAGGAPRPRMRLRQRPVADGDPRA